MQECLQSIANLCTFSKVLEKSVLVRLRPHILLTGNLCFAYNQLIVLDTDTRRSLRCWRWFSDRTPLTPSTITFCASVSSLTLERSDRCRPTWRCVGWCRLSLIGRSTSPLVRSVLGPLLFAIYMLDVDAVNEFSCGATSPVRWPHYLFVTRRQGFRWPIIGSYGSCSDA